MGKGLADRDGVWLGVYWCSIERASVREFMLSAAKLLRDCDATDVEVSALVRAVVVVEFHCPVGCLA